MGKSTRGAGGRHAGMYVAFAPRTNDWHHVLKPLFRGWPLIITLGVVAVMAMVLWQHGYPALTYAVIAAAVVLFAFSFRLTWVLARLVVFLVKFAVRSRVELTVTGVVWIIAALLRTVMTAAWADLLLIGTGALLCAIPVSRRYLVARLWCVLDRHRLRVCLVQTKVRTMNLDGALPLMLWARPTKTGERIWLWIRAGASGGDINDAMEYIAPACYARSARLHEIRKISTLVAVDIIRRDPLSKPKPIASPLARFTTLLKDRVQGEGNEPIAAVTITDITSVNPAHTDPSTTSTGGNGTKKTMTKAVAVSGVPVATARNGEDVSDYLD